MPYGRRALLFTADAFGMYNNIDTKHALQWILLFFQNNHPSCAGIDWEPIYAALEIIMTCNVFKFSDYFFLQLIGTAMGTPAAPAYAILYFAIRELQLKHFETWMGAYFRYIDDVFAVWLTDSDPVQDELQWNNFKKMINNYGILKWDISERSRNAVFLDLQLTIDEEGNIDTKIYEKAMNLYLYLPPDRKSTR